ncbi:hypothetical protein [Halomonas sp. H5]|uniref:hypothetical protein n=1 Tax=Halomonas sp. H5 TaxID=3423910 RepID=UPI003D36FF51
MAEHYLSTVITSAVVATIAGALINAWLESRRERHSTRFEALSAAVTLEGYAITCAEAISHNDIAEQSLGHAGAFMGSVPEFPTISVPAGFLKPEKAKVADKLMVFPQEIRQADQWVGLQWDFTAEVEAVREAAVEQSAQMGLSAIELASNIRKAFNLPERKLIFGVFDVEKTLRKALREVQDNA